MDLDVYLNPSYVLLYLLRKCCASKYDAYVDTKLPEMHIPCYGSEGLFYLVYEVEPEHLFVVMLPVT